MSKVVVPATLHPMPATTAELSVARVLSAGEMVQVREGYGPQHEEPPWVIVWDGEHLGFHTIHGGAMILRCGFEPVPFGERIVGAVANRDRAQYPRTDDADDARLLPWLIDTLVLGRTRARPAAPRPPVITLAIGDITKTGCDVVVNAANEQLGGGGGVDGAIHRAAGPRLMDACRKLPSEGGVRCPTGETRVTPAFELRGARWIAHAVGPIYRGDGSDATLLRAAFDSALDAAARHGGRSVAVPALSCGAYRYPVREAARIAIEAARAPRDLDEIRFVLFDEATHAVWAQALER